MTLASILLLGFLLGMRHALEADHLAAVATLATSSGSLNNTVRQGLAWGAGHTLTLLIFGGVVILLGQEIPPGAAQSLEGIVGVMLILLGGHTLIRLGRDHVHLKSHEHAGRLPKRALIVGMVHGLAGTAALVLLSVQAIHSAWALVYIVLFGCGSILGMGLLSAVIAMPLRLSARYLNRVHTVFTGTIGLATMVLGAYMIYRIGSGGSHG